MAKKNFDLAGVEARLVNRKGVDLSSIVGSASAPDGTSRDIETVTAEILTLKQTAGNAILDIGRRLIEAKEMLSHGEWLPWLSDRVEFSERTANRFMRLAREWTNPTALSDLGATKALILLALPETEREEFIAEYHVVDGEEKTAADMTSRELEQAIRDRDEARLAAEAAKADAQSAEESRAKMETDMVLLKESFQSSQEAAAQAQTALEAVRAELAELKARPVEVAVMSVDQEKLDAARAEAAAEMQAKVERAKARADKAEGKRQAAEAALAEANAKLEAAAKSEKRDIIGSDRDLAQFELLFGQVQETVNKLHGLLLKARSKEDQSQAVGMQKALTALSDLIGKAAQV